MAGRYSPIYSGVWSDDALEGAPFEEKAFFVYLWSNERIRPSGIYRVTDEQLAVDTGLRIKTVQTYVGDLAARGRIVRDGRWLFVRGYLSRQPNHARLLTGARHDVTECTSPSVQEAFCQRYPLYSKWLVDGQPTFTNPMHEKRAQYQYQNQKKKDRIRTRARAREARPHPSLPDPPGDSEELSLPRPGRPDRMASNGQPEPVGSYVQTLVAKLATETSKLVSEAKPC